MSFFDDTTLAPDDPILGLTAAFKADQRPNKVNLGVGAYRTDDGKPYVFLSVQKAEVIVAKALFDKEYVPIDGDRDCVEDLLKITFGGTLVPDRVYGAQAVGGTGALRVIADFLGLEGKRMVYVSQPSWPNHRGIFSSAGHHVDTYPYLDSKAFDIDMDGLLKAFQGMKPGSVVVLQASCHNPTGVDPSLEQWQEISRIIKERRLLPVFDLAYMGFGEGRVQDARPVRLFMEQGHEFFVAVSCSKCFGLYGERLGLLAVIADTKDLCRNVASHVRSVIRTNYSSPPCHPARIVKTILRSEALTQEWEQELHRMRQRIQKMRGDFSGELKRKVQKRDFSFLGRQKGMFSYTGLGIPEVQKLREAYGIYMLNNGRINVAGLTSGNIPYVVQAISGVV